MATAPTRVRNDLVHRVDWVRSQFVHTVTATVHIDRPANEVWQVLTNLPRYQDWNPTIRRAGGRIAPGNRVTFRMHPPSGRPVTIRPKVILAEAGRELRLRGSLRPSAHSGLGATIG